MRPKAIFKYLVVFAFIYLSLNRIVGGYLSLAGLVDSNFNSPFFSPFGKLGTLGMSPLPRAYTGLGFSDKIEIYVRSAGKDYFIDLNFKAIDEQANGHLYKYDVYLHSIFWPIKAPDIEPNSDKILTYLICKDQDFLKVNQIDEQPMIATLVRKNVVYGNIVWTRNIKCEN